MNSSHPPPAEVVPRGRRAFFAILTVAVLGAAIFLASRHRLPPVAALPEMHRTNLQQRAEGWFVPGQTGAFTGFLLDTYDDGTLKSRSAVCDGRLHGLSQGWHTNGQQQVEEYYAAGVSHGWRTKWHPNGRKLSLVNVVHGQLQGTFRSWHENGALAGQVELTDGQADGLSKAYFPSGFLKTEVTLRNGKVVEQHFYKDGEYQEPSQPTPSHLELQAGIPASRTLAEPR